MKQKRLPLPSKQMLLFITIFFYLLPSYAIIPSVIPIGYPAVNYPENCPTTCTIPNGSTLTIIGSSAVVTFNGNITIMPGGKLIIQNGATVKMDANAKIAVKGNTVINNGGRLEMDNGHITSTGANVFWSGIETSAGTTSPLNLSPAVIMIGGNSGGFSADNLIENATVGVRNYDSGNPNINATAGGRITIDFTTMRNNIRHLALYNNISSSVPTNITQTSYSINFQILFHYVKFINTANFNPPTAPVDMIYLNNCSNIPLWSCELHNYNNPAYNTVLKGINAVNSGFFFQSYPNGPNPQTTYRGVMTGLGTGVAVTNPPQTNRACIVANSDFDSCTYAINFNGCFKPFAVNNKINLLQSSGTTQGGIYMNNCTGYKVEANKIEAVGIKNIYGIIARNSGGLSNELYRNAIVNCQVGVQAAGVNRNSTGAMGLKILCNNLSDVYKTGIYVVPTTLTIPPPSFGIATQQMTTVSGGGQFSLIASAANIFSNWGYPTSDLEVFNTTNPITPYTGMIYRYKASIAGQKPIYSNLLTTNIIATSISSTCPVKATGAKPTPFPFSLFAPNNAAIEKQIREVSADAIASTDTSEILSFLYTEQAKLIDSIIDYYQYMSYYDTTGNGNYTDSIARVYQQVSTSYEYQVYLAAAYMDLGRYTDAITLLGSLAGHYNMSIEESQQVANLADIYQVVQWLQQNNGDWAGLSPAMKDLVYGYEQGDDMFAGAIARSLLAQYEDRSYDPIYIAPEDEYEPINHKLNLAGATNIYPNPATDHLLVNYTGENAVLALTDMTGREVLRQRLNSNRTTINISKLPAGMYYAAIWSGTTISYQQKIVKK